MSLWIAPSNVYTPFSHFLPLVAAMSELDDWLTPEYDPLVQLLRHRGPRRPRQWSRTVDLRGFSPKDVSVKREERKVRVVARLENGEDVTEVKRTVELPEEVDAEKLNSGFTRDGMLVLQAPFKDQQRQQQQQQQVQQHGESVWDELRGLLRGDLQSDDSGQVVEADDGSKRFKAELSVREFQPSEIRVRQQGDCVLVEAEHKEEAGGQRVHKRLERIFQLPDGTKLDQVASKLSHDGRLCIEAPFGAPQTANLPFAAQEKPQLKDVPMETEKPAEGAASGSSQA